MIKLVLVHNGSSIQFAQSGVSVSRSELIWKHFSANIYMAGVDSDSDSDNER